MGNSNPIFISIVRLVGYIKSFIFLKIQHSFFYQKIIGVFQIATTSIPLCFFLAESIPLC